MPVIAVESSGNTKTGKVSATYVTQASCPSTCSFRNNGCYAESGKMAFVSRRLNVSTEDNLTVIAQAEADAIRGLTGKLPLRVHVVGDCSADASARIVSQAMLDHESKHDQPAWTYTHAWRNVSRESWSAASVQASCESPSDEADARAAGYATVRVVAEFEADKLYTSADGSKILPCPQQTGKSADCASCRLCMGPALERRRKHGISIGFAAHGASKRKAIAAIS